MHLQDGLFHLPYAVYDPGVLQRSWYGALGAAAWCQPHSVAWRRRLLASRSPAARLEPSLLRRCPSYHVKRLLLQLQVACQPWFERFYRFGSPGATTVRRYRQRVGQRPVLCGNATLQVPLEIVDNLT